MGSPRLARIIGFLGCTQWILIYTHEYWSTHNEYWSTQSPFKCSLCEYCTVPKNAEMSKKAT